MDTQTQIDRLIELAIIQRTELKQLVEQLPQLREHLNAEVERTFEEAEPQIRTELEEFVTRQAADKTATLGVALEAKIGELAKSLEESAQAKYSALIATRDQNAALLAQAEERIAAASAELPAKVKDIVAAELARFPRAGEIDQLRKEFAEPKSLNPRGKWQSSESYNKLDLVTINGDSYTLNIDGNRTRPSRSSADWTLVAARGTGGGGGPTSLSELTTVPSNGDILIGSGTSWVTSNLTAGAGISITVGAGEITISATDGDITLDDGTAASPSLHFTNDPDTGIYRPAANTLGISVSGTQVAYFDTNGLTIPSAGVVAGGSFHGANGNANNPTFSFESDQDTGMYRHGTNELGFTVGGTEKAVLTSTTFTVTPNLVVSGTGSINGTSIPASKTLVVTTDKLSALASTSSSELAGVISDETGTGSLVFANTPTLVTPNIGAATGTSVDLSGAGTFGGNLTVSGTGTSSFSGDVSILSNSKALFLGASSDVKLVRGGSGAGTLQLSAASDGYAEMSLRGAAGSLRITSVMTGANFRWYRGANTTAESGSNTGSDFVLVAGTDIGTTLGTAITVNRATLATTLGGNLTVSGTGTHTFAGQVTSTVNAANTSDLGSFVASNATLNSFTSYSPSASLDQKYWTWQSGTAIGDGIIRLRALNDAQTNGINAITVTRSGISSTAVNVGGNLTVSGGTVTSGTGTLTLNSSANTVVLQSAGTTALTLDSSQNFKLTPAVVSSIITTQSAPQIRMGSRASGRSNVVLDSTAGRVWSFENTGTSLTIGYSGLDAVTIAETTGNATFAGDITQSHSGNSVLSVSSTSGTGNQAIISLANTAQAWTVRNTGDNFGIRNDTLGSYFLIGDKTTNDATFAGKIFGSSGTAAAPSLSFSGDTDSGFYNAGGNQVALACGGVQIWNTTVNGLSFAVGKDIYLGNAYVTGAPTATGYVTIKDSAGITYKVLVST